MLPLNALSRSAFAFGLAVLPAGAHAQVAERLYVLGEGGVGTMLSAPQSERFGAGFTLQARAGARVLDALGVHLVVGSGWWLPADAADTPTGRLTTLGAGIRFTPKLPRGRLTLDVEGAYSVTGSLALERPHLALGVGWLLPLGRGLVLGPTLRYGHVFPSASDREESAQNGSGAAQFWTAGLAFGWNGLPARPPSPAAPVVAPPPPPDRDHDGVIDPDDLCPAVPMGAAPDPARRGCPREDRDRDTVYDDEDLCPDEARGPTPDPQRPGCPSGDRDRDAVLDPLDLCPGTPAGHLPDPARAGCPTPDRDRDTVADAVDRCPEQPGIPSADPARHGCPDIIRIENGRLLLTQPVHFRRARADIGRRSIPLLEQVAEALRLAPHIRRMSLDGHTDDRGDDAANLALSQARMNSVRDWLIARGVAPDRLEAHGYGETRPLVPNDSARNRALNRRVEFIILDPPLGGAAQAAPVTPSGDETAERSHSRRRHRRRR